MTETQDPEVVKWLKWVMLGADVALIAYVAWKLVPEDVKARGRSKIERQRKTEATRKERVRIEKEMRYELWLILQGEGIELDA